MVNQWGPNSVIHLKMGKVRIFYRDLDIEEGLACASKFVTFDQDNS